MNIIFESASIKPKNWFSSIFRKRMITLEISNELGQEKFTFKTKNGHLGYRFTERGNEFTITILHKGIRLQSESINVSEGIHVYPINNKEFKGEIIMRMTKLDSFLDIENVNNINKNKTNCNGINGNSVQQQTMGTISHSVPGSTDRGIIERRLCSGRSYFVDAQTYRTYYTIDGLNTSEGLPLGWEIRLTRNHRIYYANHRTRTTQWERPGSTHTEFELEDKRTRLRWYSDRRRVYHFFETAGLRLDAIRGFLIQSTAETILNSDPELMGRSITVRFANEMGEDYGALTREYFYETSLEIVNDKRFEECQNVFDLNRNISSDNNIVIPNINDFFNNPLNKGKNLLSDEKFFKFVGLFIGLALEHEQILGVNFSMGFYENLLMRRYTLHHIQDVELQRSLLWLLRDGTDFDFEDHTPGEYVDGVVYKTLYLDCKEKYDWIREGTYIIAPNELEMLFSAIELSHILTGKEEVSMDMIQRCTVYINCDSQTKEVIFFWNILSRKDEAYYRKYLQFVTGSGSLPIHSMQRNKFRIFMEKCGDDETLLRASSCLNKVFIGGYSSEDKMEELMDYSIYNTEGFHKI
ncbi:E3 ubiquitin-protein ligase Itchy like protein [Astathelohania contejeani]|uniref:HECT-type E3 ubiquitin transferase n=1 Tax=Astathelohania contejeani TaxID=164912 RepID=A0ABQ7HX50_9MICR|nr:E3 ubiquitin-protein ligase Itchy like protein [Thelohania contejeani]